MKSCDFFLFVSLILTCNHLVICSPLYRRFSPPAISLRCCPKSSSGYCLSNENCCYNKCCADGDICSPEYNCVSVYCKPTLASVYVLISTSRFIFLALVMVLEHPFSIVSRTFVHDQYLFLIPNISHAQMVVVRVAWLYSLCVYLCCCFRLDTTYRNVVFHWKILLVNMAFLGHRQTKMV